MKGLRAGVAKRDITPPVGYPMWGYSSRKDKPCEGVHDPLHARALVLKPSILIFDEATSALDNRTQAIVTESLKRLKATRFLVAHRLSTIRSADRIYVIDKGSVVQEGTYHELVSQPGLFARLASRQLA